MNFKKLTLATLFSIGLFGIDQLPVQAQAEGILLKVEMPGTNYCHLKFPAIREETLSWNRPVLTDVKDASTGDIIDFYGPCDYNPVGNTAVQAQRLDAQRGFSHDYSD
jgi:hypothetical protein